MNRAASRRRGKRKEQEKKLKLERMRMWRRLADTTHHPGIVNITLDTGTFYCPYIPVMRTGSYVPGSSA
jgi:hypothetical protein